MLTPSGIVALVPEHIVPESDAHAAIPPGGLHRETALLYGRVNRQALTIEQTRIHECERQSHEPEWSVRLHVKHVERQCRPVPVTRRIRESQGRIDADSRLKQRPCRAREIRAQIVLPRRPHGLAQGVLHPLLLGADPP